MDDVTKRFFEVLDKVGISGASLCKEIPDLTKQKLSNARNGRNSIQIDVVSYVCSHYKNINPGYILTGEGSMFFEENMQSDASGIDIALKKRRNRYKKGFRDSGQPTGRCSRYDKSAERNNQKATFRNRTAQGRAKNESSHTVR